MPKNNGLVPVSESVRSVKYLALPDPEPDLLVRGTDQDPFVISSRLIILEELCKSTFKCISKVTDEKSRIRIQIRGMDPLIRIHTKMSRIRPEHCLVQ
jgi:hypothetical protein